MEEIIEAVPYYNYTNNYELYLLIQMFKNKTILCYSKLIYDILKKIKTYVFNKNVKNLFLQFRLFVNLKKIILPETVTCLNEHAFCYNDNIESILISANQFALRENNHRRHLFHVKL